jgi:hypothetical protein
MKRWYIPRQPGHSTSLGKSIDDQPGKALSEGVAAQKSHFPMTDKLYEQSPKISFTFKCI